MRVDYGISASVDGLRGGTEGEWEGGWWLRAEGGLR